MITVNQEYKIIQKLKSLSEIEFESIIEQLASHIEKNKWRHIVEKYFVDTNALTDLESANDELQSEVDDLEKKIFEIEMLCDEGIGIDEDDDNAFEELQKVVSKIKDEL